MRFLPFQATKYPAETSTSILRVSTSREEWSSVVGNTSGFGVPNLKMIRTDDPLIISQLPSATLQGTEVSHLWKNDRLDMFGCSQEQLSTRRLSRLSKVKNKTVSVPRRSKPTKQLAQW